MRVLVLALLVTGCGSGAAARETEVATTASSLPRAGACALFTEPGRSNPSPGVECVPPRQLGVLQSAQRRAENGDYVGAGDCFVTGYAERPTDASIALAAARAYRMGERADLARVYYDRVIASAPSGEIAQAARDGLASLETR